MNLISGGEMDAENGSNQIMNIISGQEIEEQEAGSVKEGTLFNREDKHYPSGCMDFLPPTLLQKVCLTIQLVIPCQFTLSHMRDY